MFALHLTDMLLIIIYAIAIIVVMSAAALLRWRLRQPGNDAQGESLGLDPYDIAYLTGGERLAIHSAVTSLVQRGLLAVRRRDRHLSLGRELLPPDAHLLERIIHDTVAGEPALSFREVRHRAAPALALMVVQLQESGLLVAGRSVWLARLLPLALALGVTTLGGLLVAVGLSGEELLGPAGVLCGLATAAALLGFGRRPHRSRRGDRVLARFKKENEPLHYTAKRRPDSLPGIDLALVVGLYGSDVLADGPLGHLSEVLTPPSRGATIEK